MKPILSTIFALVAVVTIPAHATDGKQLLTHWRLKSSTQVTPLGNVLSLPTYQTHDWYQATVPTSV